MNEKNKPVQTAGGNHAHKLKQSIDQCVKSMNTLIAKRVKFVPAIATLVLFVIAYVVGSIMFYESGFLTLRTFFSMFTDNTYLVISAVGMTFVIISGGIDLSVGSVAALSTMIVACGNAVNYGPAQVGWGWSMPMCILFALLTGTLFGLFTGVLIQIFNVAPFIATLAGMFMARGLCFIISIDSIPIRDPWFTSLADNKIQFRDILHSNPNIRVSITIGVFVFLLILIFGIVVLHSTKFGRNVYAIGGEEQSARLMGLPIQRTRILIYTFNGFCSALAGVVYAVEMFSGYGRHLMGMELDVIAAVVIGGTLLSGGIGYPIGSLFGVMTLAIIRKFLNFSGLESGFAKVTVGALLLLFILMQRFVIVTANKNKGA